MSGRGSKESTLERNLDTSDTGRPSPRACVMHSSESQPEGEDASEISSQESWCSCCYSLKQRYIMPLSLLLNIHIDISALRLCLLRRPRLNKIESEGELQESNSKVNFPTSVKVCSC